MFFYFQFLIRILSSFILFIIFFLFSICSFSFYISASFLVIYDEFVSFVVLLSRIKSSVFLIWISISLFLFIASLFFSYSFLIEVFSFHSFLSLSTLTSKADFFIVNWEKIKEQISKSFYEQVFTKSKLRCIISCKNKSLLKNFKFTIKEGEKY